VACGLIEKSIMPLEQQLCVSLKEVYDKVSENNNHTRHNKGNGEILPPYRKVKNDKHF